MANLYYYKNTFGNGNFYIKQDSKFELLLHKKYLKMVKGHQVIAEDKRYIGQLTLYLNDAKSIRDRLKKAEYTYKSLYKLFNEYYASSQSKPLFQKKMEKVTIEVGALAGATLSTLEFKSNDFPYLVNANFDQSINFTMGLFLDLILPRNQKKWSINNEILITNYYTRGRYEDYTDANNYSITNTELGFSYMKINSMLRYSYPIGKIRLYLNAGISNGFSISIRNRKITESKFYVDETIEEGSAINKLRDYEQGYIVGLGAKYKKLSFELRYERGNGMSVYPALSSTTKRYFILLGYRLDYKSTNNSKYNNSSLK